MTERFLRVPPFPGSRGLPLSKPGTCEFDGREVISALVAARVGGSFWARRANLDAACGIVLIPDNQIQLADMLEQLGTRKATIIAPAGLRPPQGYPALNHRHDPWHLAEQASEIWAGTNREIATVGALLDKPIRIFATDQAQRPAPDLVNELLEDLAAQTYASPFDGDSWHVLRVIEQLGEWRRLIESNRHFEAIYGVARWKRITVDPLLWDGTRSIPHATRTFAKLTPGDRVAAWKSRTSPKVLARLQTMPVRISEIEDGFIRSAGLGANCVPPLSIFCDSSGVYFDPNQSSDLEALLECGELPQAWVDRARQLRVALVKGGISKYGQDQVAQTRVDGPGRRVLVTGQVEDDRSVLSGGGNCTNLELIARARRLEPDAWIVYKPHPDVEAGHRKGHIPDAQVLQHANAIERKTSIVNLIDQVDALHVITSLAGFEALLRGKQVTTHGQPFYAGWGLTRDLAPANPRRTRKRSLDELVAAALIGYPRYVDPVTRLPCPPEVVISRFDHGQARVGSFLITLREWQGRLQLLWQRLTGARQ